MQLPLWQKPFSQFPRVDNDDPIAAWKEHQATLTARQTWMNEQNFHSLHYTAPGTDLMLGLADGHA